MRITQVAATYNPKIGRVELFAVDGETFKVYGFVPGCGWLALSMRELTEKDHAELEEDKEDGHGS